MPNIPIAEFIPPYPTHWTTIVHYLMLIGTIVMLTVAADESSLWFTLILGAFALLVGADMYLNLLNISSVIILMLRVGMFGVPVVLTGLAPTEKARNIGFVLALLSIPILALTFLNCMIGFPPLMDPRIANWCAVGV